jgi:two-component system phosphate regulon sensor histidine kinase PhoR
MKSLQAKITATYILLSAAVITAVGVISSLGIESYFRDRLIAELSKEADLALLALDDPNLSRPELDRVVRQLAQKGNFRITLINKQGKVLEDSDMLMDDLPKEENHLHRPEVQEAVRKGVGIDVRKSASVGADVLYIAKRVDAPPQHRQLHDLGFVRVGVHLQDFQRTINEIRFSVFLAGLLVLLLVLFVSIVVSERISKPIVEIAKRVQSIREGNLDLRIPVSTGDEIGQLATTVNELIEKLKADRAQLAKLEQVRSQFLANVSHELRTPIFTIQGYLETLLDGAIDDPTVNRDFLEKISLHMGRLNALLSDLIDIARIESGEMKMSFRYFHLHDFLESVVADLQSTAEQRGIRLSLVAPEHQSIEVLGDRERLRQVLHNLIENAIRYNRAGGEVHVSYSSRNGFAAVSVSDTGIGIPPEHLPRIFERFYRVDMERSRETGGTGLGLAIVKHIVEAHGGTIDVVSEVGKGSTFSFTLKQFPS